MLRAGRPLSEADTSEAPAVGVINEEMAKRYWRTESDAIGAHVETISGEAAARLTIVGVVANVEREDLRGADPTLYVPVAQHPERALTILVRGPHVTALSASLTQLLRAVDIDVRSIAREPWKKRSRTIFRRRRC